MSANELENLMSQLQVNSNVDTSIDNLGVQTIGKKTTWSYDKEQTHARDGFLRRRPLPDTLLNRTFEDQKFYIPKFNEFVIDDRGKSYDTFEFPEKKRWLELDSLTKNQLWVMFWNEHWKRTAITGAYYNLRRNTDIAAQKREMKQGGAGHPPSTSTTHTRQYHQGNTGQANTKAPRAKTYPSVVAHSSVAPRAAKPPVPRT